MHPLVSPTAIPAARRRLGMRYSLRTLLSAMLLAAIALGMVVRWRDAKLRERAAAEAVLDSGGSVNRVPLKGSWVELAAAMMPRDSLHETTYVSFPKDATDGDVTLLANLPNTEELLLRDCPRVTVASLDRLGSLSRLTTLYLTGCTCGDAALVPLHGHQALKELWLERSGLTDASVAWIGQNLRLTHLDLDCNDITDAALPQLAACSSLKSSPCSVQRSRLRGCLTSRACPPCSIST